MRDARMRTRTPLVGGLASLIALLAFLCACAPLTRPVVVESEEAVEQDLGADAPGPLARYLRLRRESADSTMTPPPYVAVLPFEDPSGFREDVWDIEREMAALLSSEMVLNPDWRVVPFESVDEAVGGRRHLKPDEVFEIGQTLQADIVLVGAVEEYDLKRLSVGDPLLGGYKSYTGVAGLHVVVLRVADESRMGTAASDQDLIDRGVGLDLMGKPRERDVEFHSLSGIAFGSEEFRTTMIGQATMAALEDVIGQLVALIRPNSLELDEEAEIVSIYGTDIFVNIGSESGVRAGYRFVVLPGLQRVQEEGTDAQLPLGVIEVEKVIGARLSSVRVLQGQNAMRPGDRLKALEIDAE